MPSKGPYKQKSRQDLSGSSNLYRRAKFVMPSGNTRHSVFYPPHPIYAARGSGKHIWDYDKNKYVDFNNNFSALIHGHCQADIVKAMLTQMNQLGAVGAPTEPEVLLAEILCERVPSIEQLRFANSGSEAVMLAIKAARAFTGRHKIAKIEGSYHGIYDYAEVSLLSNRTNWGSENRPRSVISAKATPPSVADDVLVFPLNDLNKARSILEPNARTLAAIMIDPAPSNLAYLQPTQEFMEFLSSFCESNNILFIADEIYSFRLNYSGAQANFDIRPDITTLGKVIGGGLPIGAVAGRSDVMEVFSMDNGGNPLVPHGGTFNANPITMAAGHKSLELLTTESIQQLNSLGDYLREGLRLIAGDLSIPMQVTGTGSLAALSFRTTPPKNYRDICPTEIDYKIRHHIHSFLLDRGKFLAPQINIVLSTAHDIADISCLIEDYHSAINSLPLALINKLLQQNAQQEYDSGE